MLDKELTYSPFRVRVREDSDGEWQCSATIRDKTLFEGVPYHELSMAMYLIDEVVRDALQIWDDALPSED